MNVKENDAKQYGNENNASANYHGNYKHNEHLHYTCFLSAENASEFFSSSLC